MILLIVQIQIYYCKQLIKDFAMHPDLKTVQQFSREKYLR